MSLTVNQVLLFRRRFGRRFGHRSALPLLLRGLRLGLELLGPSRLLAQLRTLPYLRSLSGGVGLRTDCRRCGWATGLLVWWGDVGRGCRRGRGEGGCRRRGRGGGTARRSKIAELYFDGCLNVYEETKALGVKPNLVLYNTLLDAMGRAKRPWQVKTIYKEMLDNRFTPGWATYAALLRAYGKARYGEDAISVYREMKEKGMDGVECRPLQYSFGYVCGCGLY
ncbi:hypothetical protein RJ640_010176 [Escallonia rubra]|uniref:Pentatricopeptide repeat-containing protein n=1 Tax=Escallonia rubra TaxID=112253 RepID=A0AA88RAS4_9ASTE|nr:hypothetical protein RJ640_010176 [Escallonia rubra]